MLENGAKIISLVPSWTETFIECGVHVVGRTRFCIHPVEKVAKIPAVGGTKSMKVDEIVQLKPDFVILDREENKKEMADELASHGIQIVVSHVTSIETAAHFLEEMARLISNSPLQQLAERYLAVANSSSKLSLDLFFQNSLVPVDGVATPNPSDFINDLAYVIWKNPYMVIGENTFISNVFQLFGLHLNSSGVRPEERYPSVEEKELKNRFCLFSSEPYPFEREYSQLMNEGFRGALIDGEKISWYGIRNLIFLESCLQSFR